MKNILLSIFFLGLYSIFPNYSLAQKNDVSHNEINDKIEYANNLIWHYNYNMRSLRNFQSELNIWFQDSDRKMNEKPTFQFISYSGDILDIDEASRSKKDLFNYDYHLDRIEKQILQFNLNCKKIQNLKFYDNTSAEREKYVTDIFNYISTAQKQSFELAEVSYDFSRSCAVNYKNDNYPAELGKVKNVVAQSKNLILAIRDNNIALTKEYLNLLDEALVNMRNTTNVKEVFLLSKSKLKLEELNDVIVDIYMKSFKIASIGELYLQSNFQDEEVNMLLQQSITEFNEAEGKMGCASAFNTILKFSESNLMYYLEEPNTILAQLIIPSYKKSNSNILASNKPSKVEEPVITREPVVVQNEKITSQPVKIEEPEEKEVFDEKNMNSLAGSLPTHLIILLDVSVSMKKSNKLPIVKRSISHFLNIMRDNDKISIIAYSGEAQVLISGASNRDKAAILDTLSKVKSSGGADLFNALKEAYNIGEENFIVNGNNKIIIASDGLFGVDFGTKKLVSEKVLKQFSLSVFHYSTINEDVNLKTLKNLAQLGQGTYSVIYDNEQAIKAMMKEIKKQDFSKK